MSLYQRLIAAAEQAFVAAHDDVVAKLSRIPGPKPTFPLGNLADFVGHDPWAVLLGYAREHGPLVLLWKLGEPVVLPTSPELTQAIFIDRPGDFYKKAPVRALEPLLTEAEPFLANLPAWTAIVARSLFRLPGFDAWTGAQVPTFAEVAREHFAGLAEVAPDSPVDARDALRKLTFDAFSHMAVGRALDEHAFDAMMRMAAEGDERMSSVLPLGEESYDPGFRIARSRFWKNFLDAIAESRASLASTRSDALALALRERTPLDDDALAASLANLYFSGLFSTSSALITCLWALSNHPELRESVAAEVRAAVAAGGFTRATLESCTRLEGVIRESMRLYPPVPVYLRNSAADREVELGGHVLPPDTTIFVSNYAVHRNPAYFDDPDAFRPERWTPAEIAARPYGSGTFWPFGRGPRACIGQDVALTFLRTTLAVALAEHQVDVGVGEPFTGDSFFACLSAKGFHARVKRAASAAR